jgi:hypothetical protein
MAKADIIGSIEKKVARLIADNRRLREERDRLSIANERLRDQARELTERLVEAERTTTILQLREGFMGETVDKTSTKAARARLNRLMREIDRCIALLNKDGGGDIPL